MIIESNPKINPFSISSNMRKRRIVIGKEASPCLKSVMTCWNGVGFRRESPENSWLSLSCSLHRFHVKERKEMRWESTNRDQLRRESTFFAGNRRRFVAGIKRQRWMQEKEEGRVWFVFERGRRVVSDGEEEVKCV